MTSSRTKRYTIRLREGHQGMVQQVMELHFAVTGVRPQETTTIRRLIERGARAILEENGHLVGELSTGGVTPCDILSKSYPQGASPVTFCQKVIHRGRHMTPPDAPCGQVSQPVKVTNETPPNGINKLSTGGVTFSNVTPCDAPCGQVGEVSEVAEDLAGGTDDATCANGRACSLIQESSKTIDIERSLSSLPENAREDVGSDGSDDDAITTDVIDADVFEMRMDELWRELCERDSRFSPSIVAPARMLAAYRCCSNPQVYAEGMRVLESYDDEDYIRSLRVTTLHNALGWSKAHDMPKLAAAQAKAYDRVERLKSRRDTRREVERKYQLGESPPPSSPPSQGDKKQHNRSSSACELSEQRSQEKRSRTPEEQEAIMVIVHGALDQRPVVELLDAFGVLGEDIRMNSAVTLLTPAQGYTDADIEIVRRRAS